MDSAQKAVDNIRKLGQMFKGIIALSDDLENIGSLERLSNELQARVDKNKADDAAVQEQIAKSKKTLEALDVDCVTHVDNAKARSASILADAKAKSDSVIAMANEEAEKLIGGAKAQADAILSGISEAKDSLLALGKQIKEKEARLSELETRMADIRNRVS